MLVGMKQVKEPINVICSNEPKWVIYYYCSMFSVYEPDLIKQLNGEGDVYNVQIIEKTEEFLMILCFFLSLQVQGVVSESHRSQDV